MCVNKDTQIPFPITIILKAMDDLKLNIKGAGTSSGKDIAKKQAQSIIKEMQEKSILPIERAKMRIRVSATEDIMTSVRESLETKYEHDVVFEDTSSIYMILVIAPYLYRLILEIS